MTPVQTLVFHPDLLQTEVTVCVVSWLVCGKLTEVIPWGGCDEACEGGECYGGLHCCLVADMVWKTPL